MKAKFEVTLKNGAKLIAIDQATLVSFRPAKGAVMPDGFDGFFSIYKFGFTDAGQRIREEFPFAEIYPIQEVK